MSKRQYTKEITMNVGFVFATVTRDDGHRVAYESWMPFFQSNAAMERAAIKAHKWADERIRICIEHEVKP